MTGVPTLLKRMALVGVSLMLVLTLAYAPVAPALTPRAHALFGEIVFDPANYGINLSQELILKTLNGIAWNVAKMAIQSLTRSMVTWINNGFEGSPGFVTNLKENLEFVEDNAAAIFISELQMNGGIDSPFSSELVQAVATGYYLANNPEGFLNRLRFNLGSFSSEPEDFLKGDFSRGGLNAWRAASQDCGNSPYCSYLAAQDELSRRVNESVANRLTELDWGNGFLSWSECVQEGPASSSSDPSLGNEDNCVKRKTRTPGSLIENQLVTVFGSPIRQLELADSVNEIVSALITQMVSQVFSAGGGLLGLSESSSGGDTPLNQGTNTGQYTGGGTATSGTQVTSLVSSALAQLPGYQQNWQKVSNAAIAASSALSALASCQRQENESAQATQTEQLLSSQVQPVVERSAQGVATAQGAATSLQSLQSRIAAAGGRGASVQLSAIAAEYDQLVRAGVIPTPTQIGAAVTAASENPALGTSDYLRMIDIEEQATTDLAACE